MKNKKSTKKSILEIVPIREITENGYFRMDDGKVLELYYCYSSYICLLEKEDQKVNKIPLVQMKDIRQVYIRRISH